jgi:hypothetical protein
VRKLIALLICTFILASPFIKTANAGYTESLDIAPELFDPQSFSQQREQLLNDIISQIKFYQNYFGPINKAPAIKVVTSAMDIPNFSPVKPGLNGNTIHMVQTSDDYSNLGRFNPIFLQLIHFHNRNANFQSAEIIAQFLHYKYYNVNPGKIAGLFRYCYPNNFFYDDHLSNKYLKPFDADIKMIAIAKLFQLDSENDPKLKQFLKVAIEKDMFQACKVYDLDFPAFLRSTKMSLPNLEMKPILEDIEQARLELKAGMHLTPNRQDYQIRFDAFKDLETAVLLVAQNEKVKSRIMLDRAELLLEDVESSGKTWWFIFGGMLVLLGAAYLFIHNRMFVANVKALEITMGAAIEPQARIQEPKSVPLNKPPAPVEKPKPSKPEITEPVTPKKPAKTEDEQPARKSAKPKSSDKDKTADKPKRKKQPNA